MSAERAIFNRYPPLQQSLPFLQLADLPTPVHRCSSLEGAIGIEQLWIKRDDISATKYGGNKLRKLEFLLAAAKQNNCRQVITFGGLGSNHALATAINCQHLGLKCVAILTPEPGTAQVRRTLRYHQLLGTRLEIAHTYAETRSIANQLHDELGAKHCYEIPFGGSSWLGAIGFVNAGLELAQQISAGSLSKPDHIYLGCGTTGSVAGLALGLMLAGIESSVEAIQVTPDSMQPEQLFKTIFKEASQELHARDSTIPLLDSSESGVTIRKDQLGAGYAIPTEAAHEAAHLFHDKAELPASLTYTAKVFAGLMADAGRGMLANKNILFWNTYNSRKYPKLPTDDRWKQLPKDLHSLFIA
ncbi:MAG: pyridoxal-phosphate dependent enzyme [Gammaproteobacteria bacterium]|nr:pyridoxal-phosphate dependent enzyme [Gammaproteobacteria bacterium]MCP4091747.1 pyridoxal-phosphate dependent enzyme [Gammaproteobacteria bacterium]MCP4275054.1 pyridoxal-phosphate dependent enzyme [Gammaproteobacteria bacterium]MCP4831878.1 pyridoxal-phosphate dependent enzyme [Gammaproteobacteria bacterium]MCP4929813.1 pyridoxal-phosphate dependent enzyme [Gammaproteobacteria bacterium]